MPLFRLEKLYRFENSSSSKKSFFKNRNIFWSNYLTFFNFVLMLYSDSFSVVKAYHSHNPGIPSWNGYQYHHPHSPNKKFSDPKFLMVDVVNNLGLKLLAVSKTF